MDKNKKDTQTIVCHQPCTVYRLSFTAYRLRFSTCFTRVPSMVKKALCISLYFFTEWLLMK